MSKAKKKSSETEKKQPAYTEAVKIVEEEDKSADETPVNVNVPSKEAVADSVEPSEEEKEAETESESVFEALHKDDLEKEAPAPLDLRAATLIVVVLTALSVLAAKQFSDQGILLISGMFVFLGAYPAIKLDIKDGTKRFAVEMALIYALCMVIFVILRTLFPDNYNDGEHAKIVIIILSTMACRLIVWPIYNYESSESGDQ
ncbi:MAG TPA: hypothetical protein PKD05_24785 [Candidatus Melainabacteria bacterium]|nr:hypothetical protein [Candidatus Melainabacteria bacterium]